MVKYYEIKVQVPGVNLTETPSLTGRSKKASLKSFNLGLQGKSRVIGIVKYLERNNRNSGIYLKKYHWGEEEKIS